LNDPHRFAEIQAPLPSLGLLQNYEPAHWSPALRGWVATR
jgi:hypothetical protein